MKVMLKITLTAMMIIGVLLAGCDSSTDPNDCAAATGCNTLFIGHSFFNPIAKGMADHAHRAGLPDHSQEVVFSGGASGSPQALWENAGKRNEIQNILNSGDIQLFGMTYHPNYPGIEGYQNWVAYALQKNPGTMFFIAMPWLTNPESMSAAQYESIWEAGLPLAIHGHIDTLREHYPENVFYCIPYGQAAIELYKLYEAGDLPDVQTLVNIGGSDAVFRDSFGHPDDILVTLAQLVWLSAIYGIDLSTYSYDPGYVTDLKAIAQGIVDAQDPGYDAR
jgi:hypothetical protein